MGWFDENGAGSAVDVHALMDGKAGELVLECVAAGALMSLSLTSDGGALGVTVTVDGRWRREYFRDAEPMEAWLVDALDATAEAAAARSASREPRSRSRAPRGR